MGLTMLQRKGLLEEIVREIRIPEGKYQEARQHYNGIGQWLDRRDSKLERHQPVILPQGSFAHQTAIRPIEGDDYDVDTVCVLRSQTAGLSPREVKDLVGKELLQHGSPYRDKVDPPGGGRRCWTIKYKGENPGFHLDVLPAVSADAERDTRMYATDRGPRNAPKWSWTPTNPQGFAKWLADRGRFRLTQHVTNGHNIRLDVDPFPAYERINPLQGAIQIMKRDRDRRYGTDEHKPISVIIATLAGHVAGEGDEIEDILTKMAGREWRNAITSDGERLVVLNPADPKEDFSDKWTEQPEKQRTFLEWLEGLQKIMKELRIEHRRCQAGDTIKEWIGNEPAKRLCKRFDIRISAAATGVAGVGAGYQPDSRSTGRSGNMATPKTH